MSLALPPNCSWTFLPGLIGGCFENSCITPIAMHAHRTPPRDKRIACTRSPFRASIMSPASGTLYASTQVDSFALTGLIGLGGVHSTSSHHLAVVVEERARRDPPPAAIP